MTDHRYMTLPPEAGPGQTAPAWRTLLAASGRNALQLLALFLKLALVTAFLAGGAPEFIYAGF